MNLLRNKFVLLALAVLAVAAIVYAVLPKSKPVRRAVVPGQGAPVAAAPAAPVAPAAAAAKSDTNGPPLTPIDIAYAQAHFAGWIDSPARDPFLLYVPLPVTTTTNIITALSQLKLTSIWRQTGNQLVVINNRIYGVGDSVSGFKIDSIEADQVWLQVEDRRERLDFGTYRPPVPQAPKTPNVIERFLGPEDEPASRPRK